ncbi:mycofactocin-coupled SDR family oxidoreductase [Rhodococcus sp. HNM0563]|uniref:mycofactocin-coupled SDR family oxidoreductase n=1 Tax=unclassified Rhodococcus (in: high G+C Gram-positive bacteria) TaxID=192944 RepID=UPI00146C9F11|nr:MULTISPECIES: mycofactocin-coupled SDR family oxidoreductase [unclassified Rhodococcus (in: high G+C Gram-positive bacteria)]MCK0093785.1 mycofactocin-coupled SDR family oxidoreductase [Rhodococcus sp. F64268]NLU64507.1 mycofactocin-coupled SDR family oxidoreductase [Rhodococcus sp. HNM0563]
MGEFDGKVVFITGIARGQGRSHALRFAREGASIIGIDVAKSVTDYATYEQATEDDFHETVRLVEEVGGKIVARIGDVRDSAALKSVVDEGVAQFGRLDVVVANAGICTWNRFWEMPDDQFEELIDINLTGVFKTLKAAAPAMIEAGNGGSIIVVSSVAGLKAMPGQINYAAAKFGLVGITQAAAKELGEFNIRVNSIHPYGVNTPMGTDVAVLKLFEKHPSWGPNFVPILTEKPIADPDDISDAVLFLASDRAKTITGSQMALDQGNSKV